MTKGSRYSCRSLSAGNCAFLSHLRLIPIIAACLLVSSTVESQEKAASSSEAVSKAGVQESRLKLLEEKKAVEMALDNSRELAALNINVQIANHRLDSAGWVDNPEFRLRDISTKYISDEFDEIQMGLRWSPPRLGELSEDKQEARVRIAERKVLALRLRQDLIRRVRRVYATLVMLEELAELAENRVEFETERLGKVEKMVELGQRSVVYFTKAKMWHKESENERTGIVQRRNATRRKLKKYTGASYDFKVESRELERAPLNLEMLLSVGFEKRPEIDLAAKTKQLAVVQYRMERLRPLPWFNFVELSYHLEEKKEDWGELMVGIDLPLFNWNLGNINATELAVEKKESEGEAVRERIEIEVTESFNVYREYLFDWESTREDASAMIAKAEEIIAESERHNTLRPDEVLELKLMILESKKLLCEKRRRMVHAMFDLFYALGIESRDQLKR